MLPFAQTDPAWEYWDTNTYLAIAFAVTLIATLAAWLVVRYWRKANAQDYRRTEPQ
jgi:heme/copper-type cytochrome/quinol oxidase subunit 2